MAVTRESDTVRWRDDVALFLFFLLVAVALGIIGVVIKGLFFLLVIGVILLIIDLIALGFAGGRERRRPAR